MPGKVLYALLTGFYPLISTADHYHICPHGFMQRKRNNPSEHTGVYSRIVVKFKDLARISYAAAENVRHALLQSVNKGQWEHFFTAFPKLMIGKLFHAADSGSITRLVDKACKLDPLYHPPDLQTYYVFIFPHAIKMKSVLLRLQSFTDVELAYPQLFSVNPGLYEKSVFIRSGRNYLLPAPAGINALYAKGIPGGSGLPAIQFTDVEQGWGLTNRSSFIGENPLTGLNNQLYREHGDAVLDIVLGTVGRTYASGIAPRVSTSLVSQWRTAEEPNDADAILAAITFLEPGDILLLEMQTFRSPASGKLWPAEIQEATFQVIRLATALGIIVIEAAGNGDRYSMTGNDLDRFVTHQKKIFNPNSSDYRDSGAVLVAAASLDAPHRRLRSTNYGKRIDCFAHGEGIVTGTVHTADPVTPSDHPRGLFGGTSAAAAIIAGAALVVQSVALALYHTRLTPAQMRKALSSECYGTTSFYGKRRDKIGVMPDLKKIIDLYLPTVKEAGTE